MDQLLNHVLRDRYQIQSLLGRKTGRRTFLAIDLQTQARVVIKLLLFGPDFTWDDLKLFEREADTLKSLDHSALPTYLDSFEVETELGKGFALVQTYLEARSLQEWVEAGRRFSEPDLKTIAEQLLAILEYLHGHQPPVIHRDIKPSNVLLGDRSGHSPGQVYLIDFGSVQTVGHGGTVTVVGTYGYMPPEQFGGRATPASDLYGLGATLIYLATGQHPADLPQHDLRIAFEPFTTVSKPFIQWLQWLTEPALSKRPLSATDGLRHLSQGIEGTVPHEGAITPSKPRLFLGARPPSSKIQLARTATAIELEVPSIQVSAIYKETPPMLARLQWAGVFILVSVLFITGLLLVFLPLLLPLLFLYLCFKGFISSFNRPSFYRVVFHLEKNDTLLSLYSSQSKISTVFYQKKLRTISAGPSDVPKYQFILSCDDWGDVLTIVGSRAEIQWLCDELDELTNFQIQYREVSSA